MMTVCICYMNVYSEGLYTIYTTNHLFYYPVFTPQKKRHLKQSRTRAAFPLTH